MSDSQFMDTVPEVYADFDTGENMGSVERVEWGEFTLGPYDQDPALWSFPSAAQVRAARMAVFPPRSTLGDPTATRSDLLSAYNIMSLAGGSGIDVINESTDLENFWDGDADATSTKYIVGGPLITEAHPASYTGNAVPLGRIGAGIYAMWGTAIHKWDPDNGTWGTGTNIGFAMPEGSEPCEWEGYTVIPFGSSGYRAVKETAGVLDVSAATVGGAADPTTYTATALYEGAPRPIAFCVFDEKLCALTATGGLCWCITAADLVAGKWTWPYNSITQKYPRLDNSNPGKCLFEWTDNDGNAALGATARWGAYRFDDVAMRWKNTNVKFPAGHDDYGIDVEQWRPGEAWHVTGGAGDIMQINAQGVVVPGTGPAAKGDGVPATKRGTAKFLASEPAFLYALHEGDPAASNVPTWVEDNSGQDDPVILPDSTSVSTLYRSNGKGWFPTWSSDPGSGKPYGMAVGATLRTNGTRDYRLFWSVGEKMYSMALKWTMYSARQGRLRGLDSFRERSSIEWGQFDANLISRPKLASHLDVIMDHASYQVNESTGEILPIEYTEWWYLTDRQASENDWQLLGTAHNKGLNILEFGLSDDGKFAKGVAFNWMRLKAYWVRAQGSSPLLTPVFRAASMAYMEIPQDAGSYVMTVPLVQHPPKDPEFIATQLESLLEARQFCLFTHRGRQMRVYVSSVSGTDLVGGVDSDEPMGVRTVTVAQIRSGGASIGNG